MTDDIDTSSDPQAYTIRMELVDEPGALVKALQPIAAHGGNLLSILHERGNRTPRGRIPVEIDLECHPDRFDEMIGAIQQAGVNVVEVNAERYSEQLTILLSGPVVETDLSDTIDTLESEADATVTDLSLAAPAGTEGDSSIRITLATEEQYPTETLARIRTLAANKDLQLVEPQLGSGGEK